MNLFHQGIAAALLLSSAAIFLGVGDKKNISILKNRDSSKQFNSQNS